MRRLLVQLGAMYAVMVVAFCAIGVLHDRPDWAHGLRTAAIDVRDSVADWTSRTAESAQTEFATWLDNKSEPQVAQTEEQPSDLQPLAPAAGAQAEPTEPTPPETEVAAAPPPSPPLPNPEPVEVTPGTQIPVEVAQAEPAPTPAPAEDVAPQAAPKPPAQFALVRPIPKPAPRVAQTRPAPPVVQPKPAPRVALAKPAPQQTPRVRRYSTPRAPGQTGPVRERLLANLSRELFQNFDLFLYVSKAESGPWAQKMFVFAKEDSRLRLLDTLAVSTGREATEPDAHGRLRITATPVGYYQLDPGRMMKDHRSSQWDSPMPFAMFFNWIRNGSATGLAIHGVEGDEIALLGSRASAGCVRLDPKAASNLFYLIREKYRGEVPRFAMEHGRYSTMSNSGDLMRDRSGELVFTEGYRVLVYIDGYGGEDQVSALY